MILTVCSRKGGVGKTMTAVHLASWLSPRGDSPALLIDGDPNRSALEWARSGNLPCKVVDERAATRHTRNHRHIVIDTEAHPNREDLEALAEGCDLLIIPTIPDALSIKALLLTVGELKEIGADKYRVLLTMVPPKPSRAGEEARAYLEGMEQPVFKGSVRRAVAFQNAALMGVPVCDTGDRNAVDCWGDYARVGEEIVGILGEGA